MYSIGPAGSSPIRPGLCAWSGRDYPDAIGLRSLLRPLVIVVAALTIAAACTAEADDGDGEASDTATTTTTSTSTTEEPDREDEEDEGAGGGGPPALAPGAGDDVTPSLTDEEVAERLAELQGRLAVGNGPELVVIRPDGARTIPIDGGEGSAAGQATWSRDGDRLAWSSLSPAAQEVRILDFGDDGEPVGEPTAANAEGNPVFYLQWNGNGERLAYIRNAQVPGRVEVGLAEPGEPVTPLAEGVPFFLSFAPDDRIAGHVGEAELRLHTVADGPGSGFATVRPLGGGFSAPAWLDESQVLVVADGALARVDVTTGATEPLVEVTPPIRFVLSPDRTRVAYQTEGVGGLTLVGSAVAGPGRSQSITVQDAGTSLVVLDLASGDRTLVTNTRASAWEWSPDSTKLAWLEASTFGRATGVWHFWAADGAPAAERTPSFGLTRTYGQVYLPFFAQYAQSVTGWSPDSSAFAFPGSIARERGIWIQLVDEVVAPRLVAPGDIVTWGPGVPPEPEVSGPSAA
ncbi:MAG: hypothetical protein AAF547_05995 [Actinomycetota bacterium]